jgi:hypothetical protein
MATHNTGRSSATYRAWVKQVLARCEPVCIRCGYPVDMSLPRTDPQGASADHEPPTSRDRRPHPRTRRGRDSPPSLQPITRRTHRITTRTRKKISDDKKKIEHSIERTIAVFKRAAHHSRRPSPFSPREGREGPRRARTRPNVPGWVHLAQTGN